MSSYNPNNLNTFQFEDPEKIKKEDSFEQFVNLSPGGSLNSPIGGGPSNGQYFNSNPNPNTTKTSSHLNTSYPSSSSNQQSQNTSSIYQNLNVGTRPVPGFKTDYDLHKASSQTGLSVKAEEEDDLLVPHIQYGETNSKPQDVSIFLDELATLSSPNEQFSRQLQFSGYSLDQQNAQSNQNSPINYTDTPTFRTGTPTSNTPPPPVIISTPPLEEQNLLHDGQQSQHSTTSHQVQGFVDQFQFTSNDFIQPQYQNNNNYLNTNYNSNSFQQAQPSSYGAISEISSADNSPYLSAYSPSHFGDDLISSDANFLDFDNIGSTLNAVDLNDVASELNFQSQTGELSHSRPEPFNRLTQENLHAVSSNANQIPSPVTINIELTPDDVQKTPSLFSSNKSSVNDTPSHSRANSNSSDRLKSGHYSNLLTPNQDGGSFNSSSIDDESLLKPEDLQHQNMRLGRQRRQSRSRETSRNRSSERDRSLSANREKMLELASPNQSNKRVQKHPSIYACHLCEKRFTRPYNLKSHLRTHTDERPFVCTVCGKAFARQHDRKRHEDLHTGKKRYECRGVLKDGKTPWGCGKKFARTDALGRHFKTEAGKECIRPLLEEHEKEVSNHENSDSLGIPKVDVGGDRQFPDELYNQFPSLLYGSQNNSGISDNGSDLE